MEDPRDDPTLGLLEGRRALPLPLQNAAQAGSQRELATIAVLGFPWLQAKDPALKLNVLPLTRQDLRGEAPPGDIRRLHDGTEIIIQTVGHDPELLSLKEAFPRVPFVQHGYIGPSGDLLCPLGKAKSPVREASLAVALRPGEALIKYNAACVFGQLGRRPEALAALRKAWEGGFRDPDWARRDPDLTTLHGDPEFERLYPAGPTEE